MPSKRCTAVHHALQGRVQELLRGFGVEATDEFGGVLEVGKQHRDLLTLAFQGRAGGQDLVGEMGRRIGQRGLVWDPPWEGSGQVCRGGTSPDQHAALLIHCQLLGIDEFVFEILQIVVVQG